MESILLTPDIIVSGNASADSTILFSDIFNLFPTSFQYISSRFKNDYQVAVYSDSGFYEAGKTRKLRHQSMIGYADDMIDFLETNNIKNIIYVAHSVNALLAFIVATKAPHLFSKIVLTSAVPCLIADAEMQCPCGFHSTSLHELFTCIMQKQVNEHNNSVVQFTDILATAFAQKTYEEAQAIFHLLFTTDCRNYLSDFLIPTVILQVSADKMSTNEAGYFMYRCIPDSQLVRIKAKGQLPYLDSPEEIIKAMKFFIHSSSF